MLNSRIDLSFFADTRRYTVDAFEDSLFNSVSVVVFLIYFYLFCLRRVRVVGKCIYLISLVFFNYFILLIFRF